MSYKINGYKPQTALVGYGTLVTASAQVDWGSSWSSCHLVVDVAHRWKDRGGELQTLPHLHSRHVPKGPAQVGTDYTCGQLHTHKGVHTKSELQHKVSWSAAAWPPRRFYALSFPKGKFGAPSKTLFFFVFYFWKLRKSEIAWSRWL